MKHRLLNVITKKFYLMTTYCLFVHLNFVMLVQFKKNLMAKSAVQKHFFFDCWCLPVSVADISV